MASHSATEKRLSRDAWLERALQVLRDEGIGGVRVERLARDLGVTKGSFYWHFDDRGDLFTSLLKYWGQQYNDVVTKNPQILEIEPVAGLLEAMTKVREEYLDQYELAMRAWAEHDDHANETIRNVYEQRKKFIKSFFTRMGFREPDNEIRTRLTLCFLSWEPNMYENESETRRLTTMKRVHEILTKT